MSASPWVYPYLGVGAGYQWTKLNPLTSVRPAAGSPRPPAPQTGAFAWQAIIGASFPIPNVPGLSLTADYRFMDILGGEKYRRRRWCNGGVPVSLGAEAA